MTDKVTECKACETECVGEYCSEFKLQKDKLYGKVGLKPYLIRTSSQNKSEEHAGHAGARLASARKWTLILDKEEGVTAGHMEIKYENFSELPSTGNCEDCLYHLNLEVASEPMLYINKEHEKIRQVLDNKGTRGSYARLREVLFDHISIEVMIKLLLKAAGDIDEEGEVRYDWESEVLDPFIKEQYPEFDLYEARNHLKKYYWKEEGGVLELLNEIQLYNQKTYKLKTHIEKLIGEIK